MGVVRQVDDVLDDIRMGDACPVCVWVVGF
jgi:hypothetical protein